MGKKRVTVKDVAKEAGVSTATVSYVLNYSETERISHETRLRVFEAVNKLKYVPNVSAKALAGKRSMLIGIIISMEENNKKSKLYQYYDLAREIQKAVSMQGYDIFFMTAKETEQDIMVERRRNLDAVIVMDMKNELLLKIAKLFYVPVVIIDGYVKDPWFCKILTDWKMVFEKAEEYLGKYSYVITEDYADKNFLADVIKRIGEKNVFVNRPGHNLADFLKEHQHEKGLVIGELLGMQAEKYVDNRNILVVVFSNHDFMLLSDTKTLVVSNEMKAQKSAEVVMQLIKMESVDQIAETTYIGIE